VSSNRKTLSTGQVPKLPEEKIIEVDKEIRVENFLRKRGKNND